MRHSQLSNEQISLALSESYNIIASITNISSSWRAPSGFQKRMRGELKSWRQARQCLKKYELRSEHSNMNLIVEKIRKNAAFRIPFATGTMTSPDGHGLSLRRKWSI